MTPLTILKALTTSPSAIDWEALRASIWAPMRRAQRVEDRVLMGDTGRWLATLPRGVRPRALPRQYARIANELCRVWNDTAALAAYLDELLVDRRGDREGFPALVQEELRALCAYALRQAAQANDKLSTSSYA